MQSLSSTVLVKEQELLSPSKPKSLLRINLPSCVAWSQDIQRKKHLWNTDYRATWVFWVMGTSHKDSGWRNILTISANSGVFTISETLIFMFPDVKSFQLVHFKPPLPAQFHPFPTFTSAQARWARAVWEARDR